MAVNLRPFRDYDEHDVIGCVISGQAVPVLTKGVVLYSGTVLGGQTVAAGDSLVVSGNGEIVRAPLTIGTHQVVGKALGAKSATTNHVLLKLEL